KLVGIAARGAHRIALGYHERRLLLRVYRCAGCRRQAAYDQLVHVRLVAFSLVAAMIVGAADAEDRCASMVRSVTRFRGTVGEAEIVGKREVSFAPVDMDVLFVVPMDIVSVEGNSLAIHSGQRMSFGIHSPSRTFAG